MYILTVLSRIFFSPIFVHIVCNSDDFQKYSSPNLLIFRRLRGNVPTRSRARPQRHLGSINRNVAVPNIHADIIEILRSLVVKIYMPGVNSCQSNL